MNNIARRFANAMYRGNLTEARNLRGFMTKEQIAAGQRLLSDLRAKGGTLVRKWRP